MNGHFLCLKSVLRMTLVEPKLFASLFCNCFDIPKRLSFKTSFQRQRRNVTTTLRRPFEITKEPERDTKTGNVFLTNYENVFLQCHKVKALSTRYHCLRTKRTAKA